MAARGTAAARPAAAAAELRQAMEDVEARRHKRNPWAAQFVSLATMPFTAEPTAQEGGAAQAPEGRGQQAQEAAAGRGAVEAAAAHVHIRTELIRSMKNALVKQTAEAVKRAAPAPAARPRLGGKARQAAAAAAAGSANTGQADPGEAAGALFGVADEQLNRQLQGLLQGTLELDLGGAVQDLLCRDGDPTRMAEVELSIDPAAEMAPPPFDDFLRSLEAEGREQEDGLPPPAQLGASEAAGLLVAAESLHQHAVQLEQQGLLQVADAAGCCACLAPDDSGADPAGQHQQERLPVGSFHTACTMGGQHLPDYLQQGHEEPGAEPQNAGASLQQWPAWQGQAEPAGCDAIQEADDGLDAWTTLEEDAVMQEQQQQRAGVLLPARQPPGLQCRTAGVEAIAVTFDDEPQQQRNDQWQQQAGGSRRGTLSELWESGDSLAGDGANPWDACDQACAQHAPTQQPPSQQPQQPPAARRVPTFAPRRQPLAFIQPERQGDACSPEGQGEADEEGWDEDLLQQVEALERQAMQGQRQQQPQWRRPHLRAPVFRSRAFAHQQPLPGGAWPAGAAAAGSASAEGIEESDSDVEAAAGPDARPASGGAPQRGVAHGAVPQLGRRAGLGKLSLFAPAGADNEPPAGTGTSATAAAGRPPPPAARRQAAVAAEDVPLLQVDFARVDLEALRPSVLLGRATGGKQQWKLAYDPEALLLPPLRAALPTPQQLRQAAAVQQRLRQQQQRAATAAAELQGLTDADLAGWDDWAEEDGSGDWGGIGAAEAAAGAPQWGDGPQQHHNQQQRCQPEGHKRLQEAVAVEWDDPAAGPLVAAVSSATADQQRAQLAGTAAAQSHAPASRQRAGPVAREPALEAAAVDVCFDDEAEAQEGPAEGSMAGDAADEEPQGSGWYGCGPASQPIGTYSALAASPTAGPWAAAPTAATFDQCELSGRQAEQAAAWPAWGSGQVAQAEPAAGWAAAVESPFAAVASAQQAATADSSQDIWAAFDAAPDDTGSEQREPAVEVELWEAEGEAVAAGHHRAGAVEAGTGEVDPWAAVGAAVQTQPSSPAKELQQAAAACGEALGASPPPSLPVAVASHAAAEEPAASDFTGLWGCDVQWEDEGPAEKAAVVAQHGQQAAQACSAAAAGPSCQLGDGATSANEQPLADALDWQYFDEADLEAGFANAASGAATRLEAALGATLGTAAGRAHAASKRRHEDIGAAIIRAMLEERQRERVDLQPLLAQLCRRLAAALSASGSAAVVPLSALRQQCLADVDASPQRYLMALLTAVHQHNSGAAARAQQRREDGTGGGDSTGAASAAVAQLAEALGERQLQLSCSSGTRDVLISLGR